MKGKKLNSVKVIFENDRYNYWTSVSAETTKESAKSYFVGKAFNVGQIDDNLQTPIDIEFIDRNPKLSEQHEEKLLKLVAYLIGCKYADAGMQTRYHREMDFLATYYSTDNQTLFDYFSPDEKAAAVKAIYG